MARSCQKEGDSIVPYVNKNRVPAWHPLADAILAGEGSLSNPDGSIVLTKEDLVKDYPHNGEKIVSTEAEGRVHLDDYFLPAQEGEAEIPMEKLYTIKREPRKSVDNALRLMRMAANGEGEKRAAVAVALADDGSYTIVDGNATVRALAELGAESVRVKVVGKDTGSRLNNSTYMVPDEIPGADADGELRTHGLDGLAADAAVRRVFEQAEENLPLLEKLVDAAASKAGGKKIMRPSNSENGLATKKPSTAVDKAKRDYKGDISRVVDLIGGTVVMPSDSDFYDALKAVRKALPEGAAIAKVKKLGFQDNAPRYKDVKVSVRFANGGIGEIILVEDSVNDAKFNRG